MVIDFKGKQYQAVDCSPEHEKTIRRTLSYVQKFIPGYWIGLAVSIGLLLLSNFVSATHWLVLAGFFSLGLTMVVCPFATPQTVEMFGMRRSMLIVRTFGVVFLVVVIGLSVALFVKSP
jgi:uncharacterized membrane protein YgaE (UPF0421/DUF939 family)